MNLNQKYLKSLLELRNSCTDLYLFKFFLRKTFYWKALKCPVKSCIVCSFTVTFFSSSSCMMRFLLLGQPVHRMLIVMVEMEIIRWQDNFHQLALVIGQLKEIILSDQKKLTNKPYYCAVCYIFYYQTCENTEQLVVCQFVDIKLFQIMHSLSAVTRLFNSVITALGYTGRGGREAHSMNFVTLLSSPSIYIQAIRACACWIRSAAS